MNNEYHSNGYRFWGEEGYEEQERNDPWDVWAEEEYMEDTYYNDR